jgi:drug/metabolite transporter (DMT)-like permease
MDRSPANRPLAGILWMLASGLAFVGVNGGVRHLGTDLPSAESAFLRFLFGLVILSPALVGVVRTGIPAGTGRLFLIRGALHTVAVILWFYAMARIPVAEVTAIGYLNPVVVTVGAALFLGERLAARRIGAILVALLGALIVLRPGLREVQPGHLAQLGAALCFGLSYLVAKSLAGRMGAGQIVAILSLTVTVGLAPVALAVWVPPSGGQLLVLAGVAGFATAGHYCMARAFAAAALTVTQPVTFLQLVWATILGAVAFGDAVDPMVIVGGAVIIGAISYMTWREAVLRRGEVTPGVEAAKI